MGVMSIEFLPQEVIDCIIQQVTSPSIFLYPHNDEGDEWAGQVTLARHVNVQATLIRPRTFSLSIGSLSI